MDFANPELLYLLVAIPAFLLGRMRRPRSKHTPVVGDRESGLRAYQEQKEHR